MSFINLILRKILELAFSPFRNFSLWVAMVFISGLTGLFFIAIYRLVSDQRGIKKTKDQIKAHLLELRLFSDDFLTSLKAQGKLLHWNLRYFLHALRPLAVMVIPLVFLLSHLNLWFAWEPIKPGEVTIIKIKLKERNNPLSLRALLESAEGYEVETLPLRIESQREICWRIRALKPGRFQIPIKADGQTIFKEIIVGQNSFERLSAIRPASGWLQQLLAPGEKPISSTFIKEISVNYPERRMNFFGWKIHWLVVYFTLSIIIGLILKKPLKVEI